MKRLSLRILLLVVTFFSASTVIVFADRIDELEQKAKSSDYLSMTEGIAGLGTIHDQRAVDILIKIVKDNPNDTAKAEAAEALGNYRGPRDPRAVEPLIELLKKGADRPRIFAAKALGNLEDSRAIEPLIAAAASDPDELVRQKAAYALGNLAEIGNKDPQAVESLIRALDDPDPRARQKAALALGAYKDPRVIEPLIHRLSDGDCLVRTFVTLALGKIGDKTAIKAIMPLLHDKDDDVRREAAAALKTLGVSGEEAEKEGVSPGRPQ